MQITEIQTNHIIADWDSNCRTTITAASVEELADSIHKEGLLAPLLVVPDGGLYRLIAGFRRYTAINVHLGWTSIPCVVRTDLSPDQEKIINLRENLDREGLSLAEEGRALQNSYPRYWSTRRLANALGRSIEFVATRLMAAELPDWIIDAHTAGRLTKKDILRIGRSTDREHMARELLSKTKGERRRYRVKHIQPSKKAVRQTIASMMDAGVDLDILHMMAWIVGDVSEEQKDIALERLTRS